MRSRSLGGISPSQILIMATVALLVFGLIMVFSASSVMGYKTSSDSMIFLKRQFVSACLGVLFMLSLSRINYRKIGNNGPLVMVSLVFAVFLLAVVLAIGEKTGGSTRWLRFFGFTFMPSEVAKLALIVYGATVLARVKDSSFTTMILPFGVPVAIAAVLVLLQPDMGTAIVLIISAFLLWYVAGARWRHLLPMGLAAIVLGIGFIMIDAERRGRWMAFLDPWSKSEGDGYQTVQAMLAFGSGGPTGAGLGESLQKFSLPQAQSDFVFAMVGEELGLIGTLGVIFLYALIAYAGIRIAVQCNDRFGKILAAAITGTLLFQASVNMGAVTGLLPVTGIPLPFISHGGTAMMVNLAMVGLLLSIGKRSRLEVISADRRRGGRDRGAHIPRNSSSQLPSIARTRN